jgi:hypothetical protein
MTGYMFSPVEHEMRLTRLEMSMDVLVRAMGNENFLQLWKDTARNIADDFPGSTVYAGRLPDD